jgi:hypothetical protein
MCRHRLSRPNRAAFSRDIVAERKDEVQVRCSRNCQLAPVPRAEGANVEVRLPEQVKNKGMHLPFGWLPAGKAGNFPGPSRCKMASAMIDRAELPVQRNSFVSAGLSWPRSPLASLALWCAARCRVCGRYEIAEFRMAVATIGNQERQKCSHAVDIGAIKDGASFARSPDQSRTSENTEV